MGAGASVSCLFIAADKYIIFYSPIIIFLLAVYSDCFTFPLISFIIHYHPLHALHHLSTPCVTHPLLVESFSCSMICVDRFEAGVNVPPTVWCGMGNGKIRIFDASSWRLYPRYVQAVDRCVSQLHVCICSFHCAQCCYI